MRCHPLSPGLGRELLLAGFLPGSSVPKQLGMPEAQSHYSPYLSFGLTDRQTELSPCVFAPTSSSDVCHVFALEATSFGCHSGLDLHPTTCSLSPCHQFLFWVSCTPPTTKWDLALSLILFQPPHRTCLVLSPAFSTCLVLDLDSPRLIPDALWHDEAPYKAHRNFFEHLHLDCCSVSATIHKTANLT